ncbi:MAG TPA: DUF423 domain-containing protein [Gammaproteobacteria bacterium]|nr:DUF423 domain-containing protein [Gammaproteobacteria bacterium]
MSAKFCLLAASLMGASGVLLGAFGAHALQARLSSTALGIWETAVLYHFIHALALLGVGVWLMQAPAPLLPSLLKWAAVLFLVGIVIFSGSLYLLALTNIRWLGAITPLGGLMFIAGWVLLAIEAWRLH